MSWFAIKELKDGIILETDTAFDGAVKGPNDSDFITFLGPLQPLDLVNLREEIDNFLLKRQLKGIGA